MSVKAGMPRARLVALEVTDSGTLAAVDGVGMTEWAFCVSTVSWEISCSGGMLRGSQVSRSLPANDGRLQIFSFEEEEDHRTHRG